MVIRIVLAILIVALVYFIADWLLKLLGVDRHEVIAVILAILSAGSYLYYGPRDLPRLR